MGIESNYWAYSYWVPGYWAEHYWHEFQSAAVILEEPGLCSPGENHPQPVAARPLDRVAPAFPPSVNPALPQPRHHRYPEVEL